MRPDIFPGAILDMTLAIRILNSIDTYRRKTMATTKLTLSADTETVGLAREIAERDGISISAMFAGYIRARARGDKLYAKPGPITRKLTGIAEEPADFDERRAVEDGLAKKYGLEQ
jgi:Family of unknown function (DUF6364)